MPAPSTIADLLINRSLPRSAAALLLSFISRGAGLEAA
jgi:hypothetical protein